MNKKLLISLAAVLLLTGCGTATLKNGEKVVAKMDGKKITAESLYNELKTQGGATVLTNMIDDYIVNKEIKTLFHDRYIVFEMNDKTTKTMLATNEVGQFFNLNTNEPLGTIMLISNDEVVRNNKNLYTMIKEAR